MIWFKRSCVSLASAAIVLTAGSLASQGLAQSQPAKAVAAPGAFAQCAACHATTATAPRKLGPTLAGVAAKPAATRAGFVYSPALKASRITWTDAELDAFLTQPSRRVPGTKMPYAGLRDPAARRQVIAYLKSLR